MNEYTEYDTIKEYEYINKYKMTYLIDHIKFISIITSTVTLIITLIFFRRIDKRSHPIIYILLLWLIVDAIINGLAKFHDYYPAVITFAIIAFMVIYFIANIILNILVFYYAGVIGSKQIALLYILFFIVLNIAYLIYQIQVDQSPFRYKIAIGTIHYIIILQLCIKGSILQMFKTDKWLVDGIFVYCIISIIYSANFIFFNSLVLIGITYDNFIRNTVASLQIYIPLVWRLFTLWIILCLRKNANY